MEARVRPMMRYLSHMATWRILGAGAASVVAALVLFHYGAAFLTDHSNQQAVVVISGPQDAAAVSPGGFSFSFPDQPRVLPDIRFADGDGRSLSFQAFRGRPMVLNIWATWCVPCRKEMPALDRLQAEFGASELTVLALSIDRQGLPVVKKFYEELGLTSLRIYIDQSGKASNDLNAVGIPTTLLVDRDGREIGRKVGPAEWDSPEIIVLIREHFGLPSGEQKVSP
jgi:thiol-disulfide isomerase/thioredoxin